VHAEVSRGDGGDTLLTALRPSNLSRGSRPRQAAAGGGRAVGCPRCARHSDSNRHQARHPSRRNCRDATGPRHYGPRPSPSRDGPHGLPASRTDGRRAPSHRDVKMVEVLPEPWQSSSRSRD
jgi:hypothetical protein